FTQKEFYQLFAYFNNVPEHGRALKLGNSPPYMRTPTTAMQRQLDELDERLAEAENGYHSMQAAIALAQQQWEKTVPQNSMQTWFPTRHLTAHFPLEDKAKPELKVAGGKASFSAGRLGRAVDLDGTCFLEAPTAGDFGYTDRFSWGGWIYPRKTDGAIVSRMT